MSIENQMPVEAYPILTFGFDVRTEFTDRSGGPDPNRTDPGSDDPYAGVNTKVNFHVQYSDVNWLFVMPCRRTVKIAYSTSI